MARGSRRKTATTIDGGRSAGASTETASRLPSFSAALPPVAPAAADEVVDEAVGTSTDAEPEVVEADAAAEPEVVDAEVVGDETAEVAETDDADADDASVSEATATTHTDTDTDSGTASAEEDHPEVAALRASLEDLQSVVASLVERSSAAEPSGNSDTEIASRIIVAANRTADATVESARTEAEALVADAKAKSLEIINAAREIADRELRAERERVAKATEAWLAKRNLLIGRLNSVEKTLGAYRGDLAAAESSVQDALREFELDLPTDSVVVNAPPADNAVVDTDAAPAGEPVRLDAPAPEPSAAPAAVTAVPAMPAAAPGEAPAPKRSNLFGGDAATRRSAAPAAAPAPAAPTFSPTPHNGADEEPPKLRAGFFGR